MGLKPDNKIDPTFNMSSMTDMIFLLLVFFMLTSNFAMPAGLPISVPSRQKKEVKKPAKDIPKIFVSLKKNDKYYVNRAEIGLEFLEEELKSKLPEQDGIIILSVGEGVPVQNLVNVASLATKLKAKLSITASKK